MSDTKLGHGNTKSVRKNSLLEVLTVQVRDTDK